MPHSWGYRARTRHLFKKDFRKKGTPSLSRYLTNYKIGQIVDVVADGSIHAGMPHKFYHGKTGVIWNVTQRAVGVEVNKLVGTRIIPKRIHVRIEHIRHSKSRTCFVERVQENAAKLKAAKAAGTKVSLKRLPAQPQGSAFVKSPVVETMEAVAYAGIPI